jgi:ABC-type transporter Mla subunit MlaD
MKKQHWIWIAELFVWLLILTALAGGIIFAKYNYKKNFNTYQIFLPDVDGLINGSPVKIMGIQIGYVNQIDIVDENVYVRFIITDSTVAIAPGTIATVEFSGLGGSKSLELYPPESKINTSDKFIITQSPKRIHDSLGLLNDMFDKIIEITYICSRFMNQVGVIQATTHQESTKSVGTLLDTINNNLDKIQKRSDKFSSKLNNLKEGPYGKNN